MKIKFISDCDVTNLTQWTLKNEMSKDSSFLLVDKIEEADLIIASRHYYIQKELDKIKGKRVAWINYGATTKNKLNFPLIKTEETYSYDLKYKLWKFFSPTATHKKIMEEMELDTSNVIFLGYPKMDLINYNYSDTLESLGLNPKLKTVLYTPTLGWKYDSCFSTFQYYTNFLVYLSLQYNFNLIIRFHPYISKQFNDVPEKLKNINRLKNVHIDSSYNYYSMFKLADMLISDVSSLAYEFLSTKKPIILTQSKEELPKQFKEYKDIMYNVKTEENLQIRLATLINGTDTLKDKREDFINALPKNSSKLIKDYIKENFYA